MVSGLIGFPLVIYPAFQVPFAYLVAGMTALIFFEAWRDKRVRKSDVYYVIATLVLVGGVLGITLVRSREAIEAILGTVYPGSRVSVGGDSLWTAVGDSYLSFMIPFREPSFLNQVEMASSFSRLPLALLGLPIYLPGKKLSKELPGFFLLGFSLVLFAFTMLGFPEALAKISLFSFVTTSRAWQALSVIAVFISIWFMGMVLDAKPRLGLRTLAGILALVLAGATTWIVFGQAHYLEFLGRKGVWLIGLFYGLVMLLLIYQKKKLLALVMGLVIFLTGMTVNPLVQGTSALEDRRLGQEIRGLTQTNTDSLWIFEGMAYHYGQMQGAKSVTGVRFYPDKALMALLDPESKFENEWNRYAHVRIEIVEEGLSMSNPSPDILEIKLGKEYLANLQIAYLMTTRDLSPLLGESVRQIYGPDTDGNRIYERLD